MARSLPPLNAVRAFEASARHLSFTKAAEELFVTPAAVSQQIKILEEFLGVRLFRRLNRTLALTEAGAALLPGLTEGLDAVAAAVRRVRALERGGRLNVSTSTVFAAKWLVPRLDRFHAAHPEIEVRISATAQLVDFARDEVDVALRYGRGQYPGLASEWLLCDRVFPVCSPKLLQGPHPLRTPADLRHHQLLHDGMQRIDDTMPDWRMWLKAAGVEDVDPGHGLTLEPWNIVLEAAIEGQGVALGRSAIVAADIAAGRLVRPFDLSFPVEFAYWLVYPPEALSRPKVKAFRDWIVGEAEAAREAA